MKWHNLTLNKTYDDGNAGHYYNLAGRLEAFAFVFPRLQGRYGRRGKFTKATEKIKCPMMINTNIVPGFIRARPMPMFRLATTC
jgi:hypothetical protein